MTARVPHGRQRAAEPVTLNIYDLSPANDYVHQIGLGFYHSGLEIHGKEYTFSQSGVFSHTPRQAPGVKFRESVVVGTVRMSSSEIDAVVNDMRQDYPGNRYNLLGCNCNSFANELCRSLINKSCPGYVNRLARLGNCFRCCLPDDLTGTSPVNDPSHASNGGGQYGGRSKSVKKRSFAGAGQTLGSNSGGGGGGGGGSSSSLSAAERRRLMRAAALARLEKKKEERTSSPSEAGEK
jgi:hypothetical protein